MRKNLHRRHRRHEAGSSVVHKGRYCVSQILQRGGSVIRDREDSEYLEVEDEGVLSLRNSRSSARPRTESLSGKGLAQQVLSKRSAGQKRAWKERNTRHQARTHS